MTELNATNESSSNADTHATQGNESTVTSTVTSTSTSTALAHGEANEPPPSAEASAAGKRGHEDANGSDANGIGIGANNNNNNNNGIPGGGILGGGNKRGKREWLSFRGNRQSRVGDNYQVTSLPPVPQPASAAPADKNGTRR